MVHVCACTSTHTDIYACMCMFINTHSPTQELGAECELDKMFITKARKTLPWGIVVDLSEIPFQWL